MKLSKQLAGVSGEYYVAAELSRRGFIAAITLRNTEGVDILCSLPNDCQAKIQVKTTQGKQKWILTKKVEKETDENKFFIFVSLPKNHLEKPKYFIINSLILAKSIYDGHRAWLNNPSKSGKSRNDSNARQFDPRFYNENDYFTSLDKFVQHIKNEK